MHGRFIIVKLEPLISDQMDQIKSTPPEEFFSLSRGYHFGGEDPSVIATEVTSSLSEKPQG
jgi:hypothetical protein